MLYLRARYYNVASGRFQSRDTWGGDANSPMSMNRWNYVEGNPVNQVDPTGLTPSKLGYLEGISVISPGFGVAIISGSEIVYDYATMTRARFNYLGDISGFYASAISAGIYFGGITGFKYEEKPLSVGLNSHTELPYSQKIIDDYKGDVDGWFAGVNPTPYPFLTAGIGYFHSSNGYIDGGYTYLSAGVALTKIKFEGAIFHTTYDKDSGSLPGYNGSGIEYYYDTTSGKVNRAKLLSDILSGNHSPVLGFLGYIGATRVGQISIALIAANKFEQYYFRPDWGQCHDGQPDPRPVLPFEFPNFEEQPFP